MLPTRSEQVSHQIDQPESRRAFVLLAAGMLTVGYLASETGVVLPRLAAAYGLSPDQQGLVVSVRFFGSVIAGILLFSLGSRIRYRTYLGASAAFNLFTGILLLAANSYEAVLAVSFLRGTCLTATITSTNGALESWFSGEKAGRSNRVHAFFGIGLVLAPLVALGADRVGLGWKAVWAGPAAGGITVLALLPGAVRAPAHPPGGDEDGEPVGGAAPRWRGLLLATVAVAVTMAFFNVGVEAVILGWTPTILGGYGGVASGSIGPAAVVSLVLSIGIFVGRRSASKLVGHVPPPRYYLASTALVAACGAAAALVAGTTESPPRWINIVLALALGLSTSALYPVLVSRIGALATRTRGRVFAVFELGAAAGGTVFPALVGLAGNGRTAAGYAAILVVGPTVLAGLSVGLRSLLRRLGADRD
jgi:fucose permease